MLKRLFPVVVLFVGLVVAPIWAEEAAAKPDALELECNAEELLFASSKEQGAPKGAVSLANTFRRYLLSGNGKKVLSLFHESDSEHYHDSILSTPKKDLQAQGTYFRKAKCTSASQERCVYSYRHSVKFKSGSLYMKFDGKKWWLTDWFRSTKFSK